MCNKDGISNHQEDTDVEQQDVEVTEEGGCLAGLNRKNMLNVLFFIINIVFTYGVGTEGWFGNGTNGELSRKYQTIITPNSSAFSIWAVIFVFQAIFTIAQLLPKFRSHPMVQQGVSYWYCAVCLMQTGWTFAFAYEVIPMSLVFMVAVWCSLMGLLYSQYYTESDGSLLEFWLLRFPFAIHGGWITAATALNVNVVVVDANDSAAVQLAVAIVSLAVLHAISVWVLFNLKKSPNYTIAGVLSWANGWIYNELQNPLESIQERFDADLIKGVSFAAVAVSVIVASQIVLRTSFAVYEAVSKRRELNQNEKERSSD